MSQRKYKPFVMSEETYARLSEESGGFCLACREEAYGVEPDARGYECEACGEPKVFGVEEMLISGLVEFTEEAE